MLGNNSFYYHVKNIPLIISLSEPRFQQKDYEIMANIRFRNQSSCHLTLQLNDDKIVSIE